MSELTPREEGIARYLDGLLEGDQLREFEAAFQGDIDLRSAIDADRRIIAGLRAALGPVPPPPALPSVLSEQGNERAPQSKNLRTLLGLAAVLAIVAGIGIAYNAGRSGSSPFATPKLEPAAVFRAAHDRGFQPAWVCEDDAQMLTFTRDRFKRGLLFTPIPGAALIGWGYANGALSEQTATLFVEHADHRIVLLVDRSGHDRKLQDPSIADPSLRMFKRVVGKFVLYEITPLNKPVVLDAAYGVDASVTLKPGESGPGPSTRPGR